VLAEKAIQKGNHHRGNPGDERPKREAQRGEKLATADESFRHRSKKKRRTCTHGRIDREKKIEGMVNLNQI